jgi:hypothetical protein
MRGDQLASGTNTKISNLNRTNVSKAKSPNHRVDINDLLSRAREDERKQKKENLVFFGAIASIIAITGIIASL